MKDSSHGHDSVGPNPKNSASPRERPILFSGEMVRAILEGRKTQTRRVAKFVPAVGERGLNLAASSLSLGDYCTGAPESGKVLYSMRGSCWNQVTEPLSCPYGKTGDALWVRETFIAESPHTVHYRADGWEYGDRAKWKPSIFMPRWASRITLEVTGVRVERIQDISVEDAEAEGCKPEIVTQQEIDDYQISDARPDLKALAKALGPGQFTAKHEYTKLWDAINKKRGFGWFANPWVWVIEFKKLPK